MEGVRRKGMTKWRGGVKRSVLWESERERAMVERVTERKRETRAR